MTVNLMKELATKSLVGGEHVQRGYAGQRGDSCPWWGGAGPR